MPAGRLGGIRPPLDRRSDRVLAGEQLPRSHWCYVAFEAIKPVSLLVLGMSVLPFLCNVWKTAKYGEKVGVDDPWGYGRSLEWATSCPPPRHNFIALPRIRSESPAFDLHHPDIVAIERGHVHGQAQGPEVERGREN
ncbi:hypothetical protein GCM10027073_46800 [Streptomyces chlorus]